jgi:exoribonuclease-2
MIAANTATARFLEDNGFPSIRRTLRAPDRWPRIVALAAAVGETLPEAPSAPALSSFLEKRAQEDPEHFAELSLSIVKLLGRGTYTVEVPGAPPPEGHFGLAVDGYAHSTAPNRRYADLVTQRLVKAAIAKQAPPFDAEALADIARRCTLQEDAATKVERQVRKSAAALLVEARRGERFRALVTGASPKGTWARIDRPCVEGRIVRGFEDLDVGDRVTVEVLSTDVKRGFIDFARVHS